MDSQERFENMVGLVEAHQYEWAIWQAAERGVLDEIDALRSRLTEALLDAERAREERNREHVRLNAEWIAKFEELRKDRDQYQLAAEAEAKFADEFREGAEELREIVSRIPQTEQGVIDFIGSNFNSMSPCDEDGPIGDLGEVRYSLTVHDILSAFFWADLNQDAIDAALAKKEGA